MAEARQAGVEAKRPRLQPGPQPRPGSPEDGVEDAQRASGVSMSVACWAGRVGVAWYSQEDGEVRG